MQEYSGSECVLRKCELCGAICEEPDNAMWKWESPDRHTVQVLHHVSTCWELETGEYWATEYALDLCHTCFKERLIPWFQSQGGSVTERHLDL